MPYPILLSVALLQGPEKRTYTLHLGRLVYHYRIVGPVGRDGCYPIVDLSNEDRHTRTVSGPAATQIRR